MPHQAGPPQLASPAQDPLRRTHNHLSLSSSLWGVTRRCGLPPQPAACAWSPPLLLRSAARLGVPLVTSVAPTQPTTIITTPGTCATASAASSASACLASAPAPPQPRPHRKAQSRVAGKSHAVYQHTPITDSPLGIKAGQGCRHSHAALDIPLKRVAGKAMQATAYPSKTLLGASQKLHIQSIAGLSLPFISLSAPSAPPL